jgi:hypothetical protein
MNSQAPAGKVDPCPASRDWAYLTVNTALWLLGAFGMFWSSISFPYSMILPGAYLVVNFTFFWRIFGRVVCAHCAYYYPELSLEEYKGQYQNRFVKALNRWYKVWILIGWVWPAAGMSLIYLVTKKPIVLTSLLAFMVISFGVFLPVLRLRVCPQCKAKELGICPFFPSGTIQES